VHRPHGRSTLNILSHALAVQTGLELLHIVGRVLDATSRSQRQRMHVREVLKERGFLQRREVVVRTLLVDEMVVTQPHRPPLLAAVVAGTTMLLGAMFVDHRRPVAALVLRDWCQWPSHVKG